jgi:hypothetical protein
MLPPSYIKNWEYKINMKDVPFCIVLLAFPESGGGNAR